MQPNVQSPRQVIFTPGRKQQSIRRYWLLIFFTSIVLAILAAFLNGFWLTSVQPVINLNDETSYTTTTCNVVGIRLEHDVTIGLHTSWRGELTVIYNRTKTATTTSSNALNTRTATIHDHITGIYGSFEFATTFLDRYEIGQQIKCYVNEKKPYYATAKLPQAVYSIIIFSCLLLGIGIIAFVLLLIITLYSFAKFVKTKEWNEDKGSWVQITTSNIVKPDETEGEEEKN